MNRLLIIDGNAMMHRAFHAIPPLTAPDGKVVNVVYGFAMMLLRLHASLAPAYVAVTFDRPAPTFRKKLYEGYQSKRPKMDESLVEQIPKVHHLVESFGIPIFEQDGFEADDVIGTLAKKASEHQSVGASIDQVIIVTGDRDILQLVDGERIMVYMPTKGISEGKIYQDDDVLARLGVLPKSIPDFKGLAGDSSDNYPGVGGVGPKTAIGLLQTFGTIEHLYEVGDADGWGDMKIGVKEKLTRGREMAFLSKDLATIRTNVKLDISLDPISTLNTEKSREELLSFHFHSLLKRLGGSPTSPILNEASRGEKKQKDVSKQQELF